MRAGRLSGRATRFARKCAGLDRQRSRTAPCQRYRKLTRSVCPRRLPQKASESVSPLKLPSIRTSRNSEKPAIRGIRDRRDETTGSTGDEDVRATSGREDPVRAALCLASFAGANRSTTEQIGHYDSLVERIAEARYPETVPLRSIPSIGPITALTFVLTLGDRERFTRSRANTISNLVSRKPATAMCVSCWCDVCITLWDTSAAIRGCGNGDLL